MSQAERTGQRDLLYNDWHRRDSFQRWMTPIEAQRCAAIDIDFCEYCEKCWEPLALVEVQRSRSFNKPYTITRRLALKADIEAHVVSYWATDDGLDIEGMNVQQIAPLIAAPIVMTAREWALQLRDMRVLHEMTSCSSKYATR